MHHPKTINQKNSVVEFLRKNVIWVALVALSFLLIPWLIGPACPNQIVIAAGRVDGSYYAFAKQYQELLRPQGIELKIETSHGSIDNLEMIEKPNPVVDLAFVQGGMREADRDYRVRSLASLYFEPVWIFCRSDLQVVGMEDLAGKRIAVDQPGSGTHQLALSLLELSKSLGDPKTKLVELGGGEAVAAIEAGEIDAAFFVVAPESEWIRKLLRSTNVKILNLRRAQAYASHFHYLSTVTLPEGYIDLAENIPEEEVQLLAPAANLVAIDTLHPALTTLLLEVASRVHEPGGCFAKFGEFPNFQFVDFPVSEDARRFFRSGPSPLFRWLPFHWAAWLDRMKLLLVPLCTLLLPLAKVAPPIYRHQIRVKIYKWYKVLREIDLETDTGGNLVDLKTNLKRLDTLEKELADISVPLSYMEEFYNLRLHVEHVRNRLHRKSKPAEVPASHSRPNRHAV